MPNLKKVASKSARVAAKTAIRVLPSLPPKPGRLVGRLAKDGGTPVRNTRFRPWPSYPSAGLAEWSLKLGPTMMKIFLSGVEGLPQPLANKFAKQWAEFCGAKYALLLPHGTDGLRVAVAAALNHDGIGYGGEVIVPNLSFIASASTVVDRGFGVALVDVDPNTYTLDPKRVEEAIIPGKTRAIMAVHLFGQIADMAALRDIAKRHSLVLLEDAAQAHGAIHELGRAGAIGDAAGFSFQAQKNLSSGEGGAFTTNDLEIFDRAYSFHNVGRTRIGGQRWGHESLGFNIRPTEYVAAVLLHRLQKLESQQQTRWENAEILRKQLDSDISCVEALRVGPGVLRHGVHMFVVRYLPEHCGGLRIEDFVKALQAEGIPLNRGYAATMSQQPALQSLAERHPEYLRLLPTPVSDQAVKDMIFLPHHLFLGNEADMREIGAAFLKVQKNYAPASAKSKERTVAAIAAPTERKAPVYTAGNAKTERVRLGVIGVGTMGREHAVVIQANPNLTLVGVTDVQAKAARGAAADFGCKWFDNAAEMIESGEVDGIVIVTPHWQHADLAIAGLRAGLHVLCEKPLTVTVAQSDEVLEMAAQSSGIFAVVHQKRFEPAYLSAKQLLDSGELGQIYRCSMIESAWRSEAYYQSSPWRGTWRGEGGGVLLNQAPHILDRYAWLCGMPETLTARCDTSLHNIEVEDTASAILRHTSGAHGYIHISTVEAPAISRTVIACDRGRITIENGQLQVTRLHNSIRERTAHDTQLMGELENETRTVQLPESGDVLSAFYDDFVAAVHGNGSLTCPGHEGRDAVELANAMLLSSAIGTEVRLPLDRQQYSDFIEKMLAQESQPV